MEHLDTVDGALQGARRKDNMAIINHAITQNRAFAIQSLYGHLNDYLKGILSEMFDKKPLQIVDKAQDVLQFQEIIRLGSYDAVCEHMVERVFRKLENNSRNTQTLIEKILARTDAQIDSKTLDEAVFYIEIRHLIVHNPSLIDSTFATAHSHRVPHASKGNKILINKCLSEKEANEIKGLTHCWWRNSLESSGGFHR